MQRYIRGACDRAVVSSTAEAELFSAARKKMLKVRALFETYSKDYAGASFIIFIVRSRTPRSLVMLLIEMQRNSRCDDPQHLIGILILKME